MLAPSATKRRFQLVLIKPSHYDDDGYVIQWRRSTIPSNSLASVYGLLTECAEAQVLGPDVDIEIDSLDECNTIIDIKGTIRQIRAAGAGFVGSRLSSISPRRRCRKSGIIRFAISCARVKASSMRA